MLRRNLQALVLLAFASFTALTAQASPEGLRAVVGKAQPPAVSTGVQHASGTQSLTVTPTGVAVGQTATLTGLFPSLPDGTVVTFRDGQSVLGSGILRSGGSSLTVTFAAAGSHALSAVAAAATAGQSATQATLTQAIALAPTTLSLANQGSSIFGQPAKLVASLTGASPTGTIAFSDGTVTIGSASLSNGSATLTYTFTTGGSHPLSAHYSGDSRNAASTSTPLAVSVTPAASTTTLTSSAGTTTAPAGTALTLTARIASTGTASGTVTFRDGSTVLGSGTVTSGVATLGTSFATPGSHSLTASYGGSTTAAASTSAAITQTVGPATSATTLAASANPAAAGHSVTLTAKVTGNPGTGSVVFRDGTVTLGTVTPAAGVATLATSFAKVGVHSLSAAFSGNATVAASQSPNVAETVGINTTSTSVAATPSAPSAGQSLRLTATVSGGWNPSGVVTFRDSNLTLGTATLSSSGTATLTTSLATTGGHSLTAAYAGDSVNAASASNAQVVSVSAAATQTSLTASSSSTGVGQSVTLTAHVSGSNPTGTVNFRNGSSSLASASLSGGTASVNISFATAGSYLLTAAYGGNGSNAASTSATVSLTVGSSSGNHPPATGNGIDYQGGPVMGAGTNIYYIWYGNWSGSPVPQVLDNFANGLGGSAWWHIATSYSDSTGKAVNDSVTLMGSTSDNYSQGKTLTDNTVFSVVSSAIGAGRLPVDPNGIYVVLSSADVDESSGFCTQYCGWHSSAMRNGADIRFAFVGSPDRCLSSCATGAAPNGSAAGDGMASILAHELAETVSDPDLNAWYKASSGEENGDLCAWNFGTTSTTANGQPYNVALPTGKFMIQQLWLNAQGGRCALSWP